MTDDELDPRHGCVICGLGDHRYGTTDQAHDYDAVACVNMLVPRLEEAEAEVRRLRRCIEGCPHLPGDEDWCADCFAESYGVKAP